ncbi:hypothetical protein [Streptomyces sp. TRM68367]|uniref:hypothetical protein n=1 Tax=Streptomyces sp. TRM68367 TaxID=2758415 RepID=UPI00165ACD5C|nr:hypothetical protein [Streptomyces sp. TRM68367]MBC9729844.1 hypothetical protein [Streptomyces sp. TRM68367]
MHSGKPRRTRLIGLAAAVAAAGTVIGLSWAYTASGAQPTLADSVKGDAAQVAAVKNAFTAAMRADRSVQAPPAGTIGSASAVAAAIAAKRPVAAPDSTARQHQLATGLATLAKYFTPAQAKHEAIALRNSIKEEADPNHRVISSQADKVVFTQVGVSGNTATVQAQVTESGKSQARQPGGPWNTTDPVGVMAYNATLVVDGNGQWKISSLKGDFVPGEGP